MENELVLAQYRVGFKRSMGDDLVFDVIASNAPEAIEEAEQRALNADSKAQFIICNKMTLPDDFFKMVEQAATEINEYTIDLMEDEGVEVNPDNINEFQGADALVSEYCKREQFSRFNKNEWFYNAVSTAVNTKLYGK